MTVQMKDQMREQYIVDNTPFYITMIPVDKDYRSGGHSSLCCVDTGYRISWKSCDGCPHNMGYLQQGAVNGGGAMECGFHTEEKDELVTERLLSKMNYGQ